MTSARRKSGLALVALLDGLDRAEDDVCHLLGVRADALRIPPFDDDLIIYWLPLTAVPYFYLYARDLSLNGRRFSDVFAVYAFNLMLIPIQLGGVLKSLHQAISGVKMPFSRTPKVSGRTAAPRFYVATELALLGVFSGKTLRDVLLENWLHMVIAGVNVVVFYYVISRLMGWRASIEDLRLPKLNRLVGAKYRP